MKRFVILLLMPLAVWCARADERGREIVDRMVANINDSGNYRIEFTAQAKGMPNVDGMYVVSGDRYYLRAHKQEQFSDGVTRWEIDPSEKDVVIDHIDLRNRNIFSNPARALEFAPDEFEADYIGQETLDGVRAHYIRLTPSMRMYGIGIVELYVSVAGYLPLSITYDFEGDRLRIRVDKFTGRIAVDEKMFVFDASKYEGYEIIDFREH